MKYLFALVWLGLVGGPLAVEAATPEDQYVGIYNLILQGDALAPGQPDDAVTRYLAAQEALQKLKLANPDWNPKVVNFRLTYLAEKIAEMPNAKPRLSPSVFDPAARPAGTNAAAPAAGKPTLAAAETEQQLRRLQDDVRRLQAEKATLEAKVREALATRPAALDPRELAKAQEKIQSLLRENELLKATAGAEKNRLAPPGDAKELEETKRALAAANLKLTEAAVRASSLDVEKEALQKRLTTLVAETEGTNNPAVLRQALAEANRKEVEQATSMTELALERDALQQRLVKFSAAAETAAALRAENEALKQQLAQIQITNTPAKIVAESRRRSAEAEARLAAVKSDSEVLALEKSALETRLKKAAAVAATAASNRAADLQHIKELETERDAVEKKLAAASPTASPVPDAALTAQVEKLTQEIAALRDRLNVFEARAVPYSAEELALFKQAGPESMLPDRPAAKRLLQQLPVNTTALAAEAQRHFAAREFDQAEAKYRDIVSQDEKNAAALANLARVQIESKHFEEAEKNIRLALAAAPDDAYSLFILGYLKLQQEKYDEALAPLSRAVKLNPDSAEMQNCLGVTLSHQGLRGPAETAFRKAIQIDPAYGDAHNNLAVIYAGQTPPLLELARWHYQKAVAAGQPKNPDLEKLLERRAALPAP